MMSTNEVHAVRVDSNARRAVVVDNSNAHAADRAYFDRIHKERAAGGAEAMLWDLLQRDVTRFNPQAPPRALDPDALAQKKLSFAPEQRWLFECIRDGQVAGVPLPKADDVRACRAWPSADEAFDALDTDGNGALDKSELAAYLTKKLGHSQQEVDQIVASLDTQAGGPDGLISKSEWRAGFYKSYPVLVGMVDVGGREQWGNRGCINGR